MVDPDSRKGGAVAHVFLFLRKQIPKTSWQSLSKHQTFYFYSIRYGHLRILVSSDFHRSKNEAEFWSSLLFKKYHSFLLRIISI